MRFTIPSSIAAVCDIAAKETSRYAINGVFFTTSSDGKYLESVATDGSRMIIAGWSGCGASDMLPAGIVLPVKLLREAAKQSDFLQITITPKEGFEVQSVRIEGIDLERSGKRTANGRILMGESLDGSFPPYRDIIPLVKDAGVQSADAWGIGAGVVGGLILAIGKLGHNAMSLHAPIGPKKPFTLQSQRNNNADWRDSEMAPEYVYGIVMPYKVNELRAWAGGSPFTPVAGAAPAAAATDITVQNSIGLRPIKEAPANSR